MKKNPQQDLANKAEVQGRNKSAKLEQSGLNTRVKGHLKASTQRNQAKRDSK